MSGPGGNESEVTQLEETPHSRTANRTEKKLKQRPNPLFVNPLSALSPDICARFPTELHDYIIDHLHNDKHTLFACSLVCYTWGASSRYHLFRNASTIRVHRGNFQQFCELLDSQRLNAYIGRLHLQSHLIDDEFSEEPTFQFNYHLHHFIGLPSLKYLRLDYHHDSLLPEFFAALARNFASVTDLEFASMHFDSFAQFVQIVDSLPLLRRIALDRVVWYDSISDSEDDDTPADHISPPTYRPGELTDVVADCLILNSGSPLLTWLASQPCIRRLAISIGRVHREAHTALFSDVLRTLGPRLEHLIIYDADNTYLPDLSYSTALQTFEITGIKCLPTSTSGDLEWVPALLSLLNSSVLQRIVLFVDLRERAGLDLLDWPRIAQLFAGSSSLRRVEFSLSGHKSWAAKAITERLLHRAYALKVGQWESRYRYSLSAFDRP